MNKVILSMIFGILFLGIMTLPYATAQEEPSLPDWFENNHTWLDNKQIDDKLFLQGMQYLIDNNLSKTQKDSITHKFTSTTNNVVSNNNLEGTEHFVDFAANSNGPGCEVTNSCFVPHTITIIVGDRVTWNTEYGANTITAGDLSVDPNLVGLDYPHGFDSGFMQIHTTFTHQFDTEGTFPYFSMIRPWTSGIVVVEPSMDEPQDIMCNNEIIEGGTFQSITVVGNSVCQIQNVLVLKNIKVFDAQYVEITQSTIDKNVIIKNISQHSSITISDSVINGNVKMIKSDANSLRIFGTTIHNNLIMKNQNLNDIELENNQIGKNILVRGNLILSEFNIESNDVLQNIVIRNNILYEDVVLESNSINGKVRLISNDLRGSFIAAALNTVNDNVVFRNNINGGFEIGENSIGKNLKIIANNVYEIWPYQNQIGKNLIIKNNDILSFFFHNNAAMNIRIIDNDIPQRLLCHTNSPEPVMKKNLFLGQLLDECNTEVIIP